MRVMVVVMMQSQHELPKVSDRLLRVNPENSMQLIGIADRKSSSQRHWATDNQDLEVVFLCLCVALVKLLRAFREIRRPSTK